MQCRLLVFSQVVNMVGSTHQHHQAETGQSLQDEWRASQLQQYHEISSETRNWMTSLLPWTLFRLDSLEKIVKAVLNYLHTGWIHDVLVVCLDELLSCAGCTIVHSTITQCCSFTPNLTKRTHKETGLFGDMLITRRLDDTNLWIEMLHSNFCKQIRLFKV